MKLRTETIQGEKVDIEVDGNGVFYAHLGEEGLYETFQDKSIDGLIDRLKTAVKKMNARNPVEVTVLGLVPNTAPIRYSSLRRDPYVQGFGAVHGILRGKNERTRALLMSDESGKKFQLDTYDARKGLCRRLTDTQVAEYELICAALKRAQDAMDTFKKAHTVDPDTLLKDTE